MSLLRHWKIVFALCALFLVGAVTGSMLTIKVVKKKLHEQELAREKLKENGSWAVTTYKMYQERLNLTAEQQEKLKPAFTQAGEELRTIRRTTMRDIFGVIRNVNVEVEKELAPEQMEEFHKLREEIRERMEKSKAGKGPGGPKT
jgi:uncharacterized membrane protein